MKIVRALLVVSIAVAPAQNLAAQPTRAPTENVTVTGTKSREVLEKFVESFAAPTRMIGKIARWQDGICPVTVGLRPAAAKFITQRVKDVAAKVGAPVSHQVPCKLNVEIVFTTTPQGYLDNIRENHPVYLGYHDNSAQAELMAKVTHAIQAWYTTATIDANGRPQVDAGGKGSGLWLFIGAGPPIFLPSAQSFAVKASRLGDGLRSSLYHVIIVVDPNKLVDYEIGSLADYITMLALSQLNSLDTCQQLPSIVNMLAAGCERKVDTLTDNDLGYLRGLYKMNADWTARSQQDEIAYQMEQSSGAGK